MGVCSLTNQQRFDGALCRGMDCEPCKAAREKKLVILTSTDIDFISRNKKSNDMGRIKINCKIMDLKISMEKVKEIDYELNNAIVEVLKKYQY